MKFPHCTICVPEAMLIPIKDNTGEYFICAVCGRSYRFDPPPDDEEESNPSEGDKQKTP